MKVGERIKKRRKQLKMSVEELAEKLGKNRATVYRYESNDIENMPLEILEPLAVALNVSPAYLMGWESDEPTNLATEYEYYPVPISAGVPMVAEAVAPYETKKLSIPDSIMGKWAGSKDIFVMKVNGDSMNNIIPDGSIIAVKPIDVFSLKDNDIVVFSNCEEYSVKRFYDDKENNRVIFRPDSTDKRFVDYAVSYEEAKELRIHGKVVLYIVELD